MCNLPTENHQHYHRVLAWKILLNKCIDFGQNIMFTFRTQFYVLPKEGSARESRLHVGKT
jgi:hypothetical protein